MSEKMVSFMMDEDLYRKVQELCFKRKEHVKTFFKVAAETTLELTGDNHAKPITKTPKRTR